MFCCWSSSLLDILVSTLLSRRRNARNKKQSARGSKTLLWLSPKRYSCNLKWSVFIFAFPKGFGGWKQLTVIVLRKDKNGWTKMNMTNFQLSNNQMQTIVGNLNHTTHSLAATGSSYTSIASAISLARHHRILSALICKLLRKIISRIYLVIIIE